MIFLTFIYNNLKTSIYESKSKVGLQNMVNQFQYNIIDGLIDNNIKDLKIVNFLPVGSWPNCYSSLFLKTNRWKYRDVDVFEIGSINIPYLKQKQRLAKLIKFLNKQKDGEEILIYSANNIFLNAINKTIKKKGFKTTLIIPDLPNFYNLSNKKQSKYVQSVYNQTLRLISCADRYIFLTKQMKDYLKINNKPFDVVEGVISQNFLTDKIRQTKSNNAKKTILYTGTMHKQFGILNLINAFLKLKYKNCELLLCGKGDCESEINDVCKSNQNIKYLGYVSQNKIKELQSKAAILVNPRQNVGDYTKYSFPSKTMEYMASGIPVVMYKLDGIPDDYDKFLFYVENNSVKALTKKLDEVLNLTDKERFAFGNKAKNYVLKNKNHIVQTKKIINLIQDNPIKRR